MIARAFSTTPTLVGELVTLRPVTSADAPGLVQLLHDPDVRRLTGTHGHVRPGALERATEYYDTRAADDSTLHLAIVERASDEYVGEIVLENLDPDNQSCTFRIALRGRQVTGRGYGTEATRLLLDHAFGVLGLHRIELEVLATNPRARHVYAKLGFVTEGVRREAVLWEGARIDVEIMARLSTTDGPGPATAVPR